MKTARYAIAMAAAALAFGGSPARADDYPSHPVAMVLGYEAGGPTDVIARVVAKEMAQVLKGSVVDENKPGASAHIAAADVMRSQPDGYRVLVTSLTLSVNPLLYPDRYKYDSVNALEPVSSFANLPMVLVVNDNSPYKTVKDLVDDARAHPDRVTFGSSGVGGSAHLAAEMLGAQAGLKMVHVPFKGNAPALQELIAGRISFMFYPSIGIANYVAGKQLRVLAVGSKEPRPDFPGVPTLDSQGFQGFEQGAPWVGMLAPKGTPQAVIDKLYQASSTALRKPEVRAQLAALGATVVSNTPEQFKQFLVDDRARWADVIKKGNVKGE
jgi:tripartite-type tricarboxylate transporter receptor subunit TctC